eukprot:2111657-Alexandrium_andersonii.AAC.1
MVASPPSGALVLATAEASGSTKRGRGRSSAGSEKCHCCGEVLRRVEVSRNGSRRRGCACRGVLPDAAVQFLSSR